MTSGTPCVLTSSSFPGLVYDKKNELIYDGVSHWSHNTAHLMGQVKTIGLLLLEKKVVVRGDIAEITLGNAVILREQCVLRPPLRSLLNRSVAESTPVIVGSMTVIGRRVVSEAQSVGNFVLIEDECVISEWVEIPDGVWLRSGSIVPSGVRLAPYVVYEGRPARPIASVDAELHQIFMTERVNEVFSALMALSS
ncbi:trimeric LpxA-like protein [Trypanosoma theileri]|uniref:Dynactin subunit 5 n=1 Tax=Trypanosoma theileri TaxID=67003 RepID=A0A1X0P242_9TRYP|nr:trimeric LpxA-like protein [Trypanosoma theileri]ORC91016.1 trimeric LpxA-like protein [Trypanosoma theileri]